MTDVSHELELLSRRINQVHRSVVQERMGEAGLSEVGHPILLCILESAGCCQAQKELAGMLQITPAAVASSLKTLERDGYIQREPVAGDARRNQVSLTDKGSQAVRGCHQVLEGVSAQMLQGFTQQEREQLLSFRRRILNNLETANQKEE